MSQFHDEKRQRIVNRARSLFLEQGVSQTSISQIAHAVGVAKGLFYYYFKTKEDVLYAVIDQISEEYAIELSQQLKETAPDFYLRLLTVVNSYYDLRLSYQSDSILKQNKMDFMFIFHRSYLLKIKDVLNELIAHGESEGILKLEYPQEMLFITLEGIFGLMSMQRISRGMVARLIEQVLNLRTGCLEAYQNQLIGFEEEEVDAWKN